MQGTGRAAGQEWTLADVRRSLAEGFRVLLLVRHGERPHIDHEDRTFGGALPLTETGIATAEEFGRRLAGACDGIAFRASPLRRTVMTAEAIARGLGAVGAPIVEDERIGNGSAYVADAERIWALFRDGSFFEKMGVYLAAGRQDGFREIREATDAFEAHALGCFTSARLGIFATHDVYIAAFLHARGVKTDFDAVSWPRFLDAAAIILGPDGTKRYAFVRTGLSDRVTGVSWPRTPDAE